MGVEGSGFRARSLCELVFPTYDGGGCDLVGIGKEYNLCMNLVLRLKQPKARTEAV